MRDASVMKQFTSLLEENWDALETELGPRWGEFIASYRDIVESLPLEPVPEDVAQAMLRLLGLLHQREAGRRLLRKNIDLQTRLIGSGPEVLPNKVSVKQVANRLIDLLKREEGKEKEKPKSAGRNAKDT